jgi:hypothetical protein
MIPLPIAFSSSYAQARVKFLEAAATASLRIESLNHPLPGRDGEPLAMDVALDGPRDAQHLLIVSSACHGVEGFCGSGVQVFALHDTEWREKARAASVAVLYIHALNPYGFSHTRRVTHEGVDINRNFQNFSQALPTNSEYAQVQQWLLPKEWPPSEANETALNAWAAQHGQRALQTAITGGQYQFPNGLFYGGQAPTWSNQTLRHVLRRYGSTAQHLAWIDLHTGLGPRGVGERIFACKEDAEALARTRAWWGDNVTSVYDGSSSSANLSGLMWLAAYQECPQAQYTGIALEYGTVPLQDVLQALRAEQWLHNNPQAPREQALAIKQQLRDAFYVDADDWKGQVISQARQAMFQAVDGLATSKSPAALV